MYLIFLQKSRLTKDASGSLHMQYLIGLYIKPSESHLTHAQSQEWKSQEEKLGKNIDIDRQTNVSRKQILNFPKRNQTQQ